MAIKDDFLKRANYVSVVLVLIGVAIVGRLVYIQYFQRYQGKPWVARLERTYLRPDTLRAMRGNIYAADGSLLATSLPTYEVGVDPTVAKAEYFNAKVDSLGLLLSRIFKDRTAWDYARMARDARRSNRQFIPLNQRRVSFTEREEMRKWPFFRRSGRVSPRGGVLRPYYERYHPFGDMAKRTLGDLNPASNKGLMGLEASFQTELAGKHAVGLVEVLKGGIKRPIIDGPDMRPEPGMDLYTTIDVNYQDMAETSLRRYMEKFQADKGCVVVMETTTGEIRAMANLTRYAPTAGAVQYLETFNHALAGRTDPGSTFKLASMMALLEEKAVWPGKLVNTGGGRLHYRDHDIVDPKRGGYGLLTAQQVLEKSSNIGIHLLMQSHFYRQPERYCQYLHQFRLDLPTGIQMKGEGIPLIRNPDSKGWSRSSISYMAYGYEMLLTPLQMLTFYNAVANDGRWVRPQMVREIRRGETIIETIPPYAAPDLICSRQTAHTVKKMLEGVVERGTARSIWTPHYRIAGKTGTAQKNIGGQFRAGHYYSSFIGYFPAEQPRYTVLAAIDNPRFSSIDSLYGGKVAAPVFREVADRIHAYDIRMHRALSKPTRPETPELLAGYADDLHQISSTLHLDNEPSTEGWVRTTATNRWQPLATRPGQVPDVRGLTLRDALFLLENQGLRVALHQMGQAGRGRVMAQSVVPGTKLARAGGHITLTLGVAATKPKQPVLEPNLNQLTRPKLVASAGGPKF